MEYPDWLEIEIIERDKDCVYCHTTFGSGTVKRELCELGTHRQRREDSHERKHRAVLPVLQFEQGRRVARYVARFRLLQEAWDH